MCLWSKKLSVLKLFFCFTFLIYCSISFTVNDCHSVMIAFMLSRLKCEELSLVSFIYTVGSYHMPVF